MSICTPRRRPSWKQGFARNAAESKNPGLWKGLRGLWAPVLGPTGTTLRDVSGYGNHGVLTNMDPATDWVTNANGYALAFDKGGADNAGIIVPTTAMGGLRASRTITVVCLVEVADITWNSGGLFDFYHLAAGDGWYLSGSNSADTSLQFSGYEGWGGGTITSDAVLTLGDTINVVCTCDGTTGRMWIDGVEQSTTFTLAAGVMTVTQDLYFGNRDALNAEFICEHSMFGVWDHALTPNEIQQLYEQPLAPLQLRRRVYPAAVGGAPPATNRRRRFLIGAA